VQGRPLVKAVGSGERMCDWKDNRIQGEKFTPLRRSGARTRFAGKGYGKFRKLEIFACGERGGDPVPPSRSPLKGFLPGLLSKASFFISYLAILCVGGLAAYLEVLMKPLRLCVVRALAIASFLRLLMRARYVLARQLM